MIRIIVFLLCILTTQILNGQTIYSKAYGESENPVIIFIHGGPRGNSTLFEGTTAEKLAEKGFYVIAYDRRGEGRSIDTTANFTFQEAIDDLNNIYKKYDLIKLMARANRLREVGRIFLKIQAFQILVMA